MTIYQYFSVLIYKLRSKINSWQETVNDIPNSVLSIVNTQSIVNIQPNRWSCVLTAFANAVNIDQNEIIDLLGHDGSEIIFPDLPEPSCRRGFDPREIIYILLRNKKIYILQLDRFLDRRNPNGEIYSIDKTEDLYEIMKGKRGVLTGTIMGRFHAYAWDGEKFVSSSDMVHTLENLNIHTFFMVI